MLKVLSTGRAVQLGQMAFGQQALLGVRSQATPAANGRSMRSAMSRWDALAAAVPTHIESTLGSPLGTGGGTLVIFGGGRFP